MEKIHANSWGPYSLLSQSESTYAAILIYGHIQRTWTIHLRDQDNFVDVHQAWLPWVEAKSDWQMKIFRADSDREFISNKLQSLWHGITIKYTALYMHE